MYMDMYVTYNICAYVTYIIYVCVCVCMCLSVCLCVKVTIEVMCGFVCVLVSRVPSDNVLEIFGER